MDFNRGRRISSGKLGRKDLVSIKGSSSNAKKTVELEAKEISVGHQRGSVKELGKRTSSTVTLYEAKRSRKVLSQRGKDLGHRSHKLHHFHPVLHY